MMNIDMKIEEINLYLGFQLFESNHDASPSTKNKQNELETYLENLRRDIKKKYKVETLKREVLETYMTNAEDVLSDVKFL